MTSSITAELPRRATPDNASSYGGFAPENLILLNGDHFAEFVERFPWGDLAGGSTVQHTG
jgi:hypothetical protein